MPKLIPVPDALSKPFWDAVGLVLPDYKVRRAQLRRDGDTYRL